MVLFVFVFKFTSAYPIVSQNHEMLDIQKVIQDSLNRTFINSLNGGFNAKDLIQGSLQKTLENITLTLPKTSSLPLENQSDFRVRDILNIRDIDTSDLGGTIKSVVLLALQLLLIALVTIAQVLKVFIDLVSQ